MPQQPNPLKNIDLSNAAQYNTGPSLLQQAQQGLQTNLQTQKSLEAYYGKNGGNDPYGLQKNYGYSPYQIQTADTFETIAQKNNLTAQHLQAANNGMAVPPPKGSMINIPRPGFSAQAQADYYNHPAAAQLSPDQHMQQLISQGVPPGIAAMVVRAQAEHLAQGAGQTQFRDRGVPLDFYNVVKDIQNSTEAPTNVPANVLSALTINGQAATPQSMIDNGYTFNQATQSWVLGGAQAAGSVTTGAGTGSAEFMNTGFMQRYAEKGTPFLQQKRWDPSTKKFVSIGKLIRQGKLDLQGRTHKGKKKNNGPAPVTVAPASNAGGAPSTVLDLHLGSG